MNRNKIIAIASIGLLIGACDDADNRDYAQKADPAPTHKDATPATPKVQPRRPDYADTTPMTKPGDTSMQNPRNSSYDNSNDVGDIEGKELVGANGEELGEVDRIVVDRKTGLQMAVIGLKGIVGDGAKEVVVPMSQIRMSQDGDKVVTSLSKQSLEARPDVDLGDYTDLTEPDL